MEIRKDRNTRRFIHKTLLAAGYLVVLIMEYNVCAICEKKRTRKFKVKADKYYDYYRVCNKWLLNKNRNLNIADYLRGYKYEKVSIYGMGDLGNRLYEELLLHGIMVAFTMDKDACNAASQIDVYEPGDQVPETDIMIVTTISAYEEVKTKLKKRYSFKIVSLEDIVFAL